MKIEISGTLVAPLNLSSAVVTAEGWAPVRGLCLHRVTERRARSCTDPGCRAPRPLGGLQTWRNRERPDVFVITGHVYGDPVDIGLAAILKRRGLAWLPLASSPHGETTVVVFNHADHEVVLDGVIA